MDTIGRGPPGGAQRAGRGTGTFLRSKAARIQLALLHAPVALVVVAGSASTLLENAEASSQSGIFHVLLGAGLWWLVWIVRRFRFELGRTVSIDEEGIALATARGGGRLAWGEISEVWLSAKSSGVLFHVGGAGLAGAVVGLAVSAISRTVPPDLKLRLVGKGGELMLDDGDLGIGPAVDAVVARTSRRLAADLVRRALAGESIRFGKEVVVSRAGILFPTPGIISALTEKSGVVPWSRVEWIRLREGRVEVSVQGELGARHLEVEEIANVFVLGDVVLGVAGRPIPVELPSPAGLAG